MTRTQLKIDEMLKDPFAALARARAEGPVVLSDPGGVAVVGRDAVRSLLADGRLRASFPDFLRQFGVTDGPFFRWMSISPLNLDGPEHQRWRTLMSRTFTPRSVESLRPFLRRSAHELIDGFAAKGACEFMAEFADAFPSLGLCELIGVPLEDRDRFRAWSNTIGLGFSPFVAAHIAEVDAALERLLEYTAALATKRRADPHDDLVTRIAQTGHEEGWSDFEIAGFIAGLVFAGHETTKNQLGWMVSSLAERPDLWDAVAAGTLGAPEVVEEILRYRSAVTGVGRKVAEPVEIAGETLAAGDQVFLSIWGADHDEAAYPHADRVDPAQAAAVPHLAFGHGAHHCIGAALARAELQEALAALTARIGCPTVEGDSVWRPPVGINGPERLPLRFAPRT